MSQPDPPAPDLGTLDAATRKRLENVRYPQRAMAMDVRTILAAYDAQAARLAAVEPVLRAYREQHDICAADSDEGFDRCPCEICDAAVAAGAAEGGGGV